MSEAAWDKAFTQGSKAMQDRLRKVHAKNPKFQSWLQKSGHAAGTSVKQASKEVKPSARVKSLQVKSLKAYGATKGVKVGGEHGSDEVKDTIAPLTRDQHSKVQAAQRAAKAATKAAESKKLKVKKPLSQAERMAAIARAVTKAKSKDRFDVPTVNPDDMDHDDLRDLHQSLHVSRSYNEEVELDEMDKSQPSSSRGAEGLALGKKANPVKTDKVKSDALKLLQKQYKKVKEEVEVDESVATAQKVMDRANVVAKTNPDPKKRFAASGLAQKAMMRTINPTGVNTGIVRGGGNKTYRMITGKAPPYQLTKKKGVSEEIEMNEGKMKDIVTDREETARLAAQKEPPFTPDKKKIRRGSGGPMSQAKWLAKQAMMKVMNKEEVEQIDERNKENKAKKDAFVSKIGQTEKDRMVKSFKNMPIEKNYGAAAHAKNLKSVKDTHVKTYGRGEVQTDNVPRSKKYKGNYEFSNVGEEVDLVSEQDDTTEKLEMAQTQLHFIRYAANEILEFIKMDGKVEEWYQNKLSKVHSDMESLHSYIEGEMRRTGMKEEVEEVNEEKLDPVGKEDSDIDNDGDTDKTDVYLHRKRKAIGAAIKKRVADKMGKK